MKRYIISLLLLITIAATGSAQLLYKVTGRNLPSPAYIFGTHHLAPLSVIDSVAPLQALFDDADILVGEVDLFSDPQGLAMLLQQAMTAPADSTLTKILDKEEYNAVDRLIKRYAPMPGMSVEMLDNLKPIAVATLLTVGIMSENLPGGIPDTNLDTYLQQEAHAAGKAFIPLETPAEQATLLYGMNIADQKSQLLKLAEDPEGSAADAAKINSAYFSGDLDKLYALARENEADNEFYDRMLITRNRQWLALLPDMMSKGKCIIAVGALHLPGQEGLLSLLRQAGYEVSPATE